MAKGITDVGKFIRGILIREMQIPENQPWTVWKAADLLIYAMMASKDPVIRNGLEELGFKPPKGLGDPKYKYEHYKYPKIGDLTDEYKKRFAYCRKLLRRELARKDSPFEVIINPNADSGDGDEIRIKPDAGV